MKLTMGKSNERLPSNPKAMGILKKLSEEGVEDKQICEALLKDCGYSWNIETIRRNRRKLGINKKNKEIIANDENQVLPPPGLKEKEKADWFRKQFKITHLYTTLETQFDSEEINNYIKEYGSLCCQFEDIVTSEFFQIDDFLKHRILINRQLVLMKSLKEEIDASTTWVASHPMKEGENKDDVQTRVQEYRKLDTKRGDLGKANERYDKLVAERQKIYQNLAATRKDRVEELRGGKENFFTLVALLQASELERNNQGKYAELTRMAAEDIKNEFRKPQVLPDDTLEPLIMDSLTYPEEMSDNG